MYKGSDGTGTIKWNKPFDSEFQIVLNTDLAFKSVSDIVKVDTYWNFKITLKTDPDAILPVNSKVFVDILDEDSLAWYIGNCIATNANLLTCDSNSRTTNKPKLSYLKSLDSSVTWKNKNRQDYITLESITDDPNEPEPTTTKSDNTDNTGNNDNTGNTDITGNTDNTGNTGNNDNNKNQTKGGDKNGSIYLVYIKFYLLFILILV